MAIHERPKGEGVVHKDYGYGAASDGRDVIGGVVSEQEDLSNYAFLPEGNSVVQSEIATANATVPTKPIKNHVA